MASNNRSNTGKADSTMSEAYTYAKDHLTKDQQKTIAENLATLDYLEGSGVTTRQKSKIRDDTVYLIMGLGGQGTEKLGGVKRQLYRDCDPTDIQKHVRFLAVDTACGELDNNQQFGSEEVVKILPGTAQILASPKINDTTNPQFLPWVHPQLNSHLTGLNGEMGWNGDGAARCRQVGRVKLADAANMKNLKSKVAQAVVDLNGQSTKDVRVIIIAGIAGGTGSGTIVDVPYIVRDAAKKDNRIHLTGIKFVIEGYILLPSACASDKDTNNTSETSGNRNAYAALKEIDYLMRMRDMHGANPEAHYEFCGIESTENIFNTCTLVGGMYANGGIVADTGSLAREVVAHTIVSSMVDLTAEQKYADGQVQQAAQNNKNYFGSPSYISNIRSTVNTQLQKANYQQCPREAGYTFLACGYSEVVVPVDLMKAYVANKVYQAVYQEFKKADTVTKTQAEKFLEKTGLTVRSVRARWSDNITDEELLQPVWDGINQLFKSKGPFYMVNLLRLAAKLLSNNNINNQHPGGDTLLSKNWDNAKSWLLNKAKAELVEKQSKLYNVYTIVIEELAGILSSQAGILTDTNRMKGTFNETFTWTPVDLQTVVKGNTVQNVIKEYLDNLIDAKTIQEFSKQFTDLLVAKKDEWTDLDGKDTRFNVAGVIRGFIENQISHKVTATIEDFLVKLYAGNKDATAQNNPAALDEAAGQIIAHFDVKSSPLAAMEPTDLQVFDSGLKNYIVPATAPNLKAHLAQKITTGSLYTGGTGDRLVCINLYAGVPAFFYEEIRRAEADYEMDVNAIGLHMDQTGGKEHGGWADLPNLVPEARKRQDGTWNKDGRDEKLQADADTLLEDAKKYGLVHDAQAGNCTYNLWLLPQDDKIRTEDRPAHFQEKIKEFVEGKQYPFTIGDMTVNNNDGGSDAHALVDDLLKADILEEKQLQYGTQTMLPGVNLTAEQLEDYKWQLAKKLLRKSNFMLNRLQETVDVLKKSEADVRNINEQRLLAARRAERKDIFRQLLLAQVVYRDPAKGIWYYTVNKNANTPLLNYGTAVRAVKKFNLYAAYLAFAELKDENYQSICTEYEEVVKTELENLSMEKKDARQKTWYNEVHPLLDEKDFNGTLQLGATNFASKLGAEAWLDNQGNPISAEELKDFYTYLDDQFSYSTVTPPAPQPAPAPDAAGWECPKCHASNAESSKFCSQCGTARPAVQENNGSWECPGCHASNDASSKFCSQCGAARPAVQENNGPWECPKCHASNDASSKFCPECGTTRP